MTLSLGITDYVVIGLMLCISAGIGIFFRFTGGKQKTTEEFLMAGRDMPTLPVAFSLMATYMSAISVLGLPAETYKYGTQFAMWIVSMPIGAIISAYVFLPVFFEMEASTAYEYLEKRFGKLARSVVSLMFALQMILYMAVVLYAPSLALNAVTGLSTWTSVFTLAAVCTFYCSLGGLKAVLWTDVFQSILMYTAIISIVIKASINIGGFKEVFDIANKGGRMIFFETSSDFTVRYTLWNALISGIVFSANTFGTNQAQIQRMLSVKSLKKAQRALFFSLPLIFVFNVFCFWDGLAIYSLFHDCDPLQDSHGAQLTSADQLLPYSILKLFGHLPGFSGLCIAGVFSASLSTISSAMNSLTAVTMEDFIRPYCFCKRLNETWAAFLAKAIAIAYGGLCLLFTYVVANFRGVLEASNVLFGMVGGPVLGLFSLGMLTTTANQEGTLIGLLAGFCLSAWMGFGSYSAEIEIPQLPQSIEGCSNDTYNASVQHNFTEHPLIEQEHILEDYVFPMYKISFMWFPVMGTLATIIIGYISSFLISCCRENPPLKQEFVSPVVRRWIYKDPENEKKSKLEIEVINLPQTIMRDQKTPQTAQEEPKEHCIRVNGNTTTGLREIDA